MTYYALYDDNDRPLGTFTREQLEKLLKTSRKSFICIMSRLHTGNRHSIYYDGKRYKVFIYKER